MNDKHLQDSQAENSSKAQTPKKAPQTPGERLRALRKENHLTQEQLAELLHVEHSKISKMENDRMDVPSRDAINLRKIFNTTLDFILCGITSDTAMSPDFGAYSKEDALLIKTIMERLRRQ